MKLREILYFAGLKPKAKEYGVEVRACELPREGRVEYAKWLHPRESDKPPRQEVVDHLRTFLRPGDVCVDVGAHSGDTAIPMALAVGPSGCVLAFEPNRYVFKVLERAAALNPGKTRVVPYCLAVTPEDGKMTFEYSDSGFCNGGFHEGISRWKHGHAFELEVEGVRLEPFLAARHPELVDRVRFVKIDTEGFERSVIESIRGLLLRARPFVQAEVFRRTSEEQRRELLATITALGYRARRVLSESSIGEEVGEADLMKWPHYDLFCEPA